MPAGRMAEAVTDFRAALQLRRRAVAAPPEAEAAAAETGGGGAPAPAGAAGAAATDAAQVSCVACRVGRVMCRQDIPRLCGAHLVNPGAYWLMRLSTAVSV
jgi:hypothetical protein